MESVQNLKKRLKSVANVGKITKAMELVAATKMRRAQEIALASRPYALTALDLLANVSLLKSSAGWRMPELFLQRNPPAGGKKVLFVLVASDKGLAGAFNSSLFRKFEKHIAEHKEKYQGEEKIFIAVGEKSFAYLQKKEVNVIKKFVQVGDHTTVEQVQPLAEFIIEGYLRGGKTWPASNASRSDAGWDRVVIFSTHFKSALKQEALVRRVLPVDFDHIREIVQEITPTTGKFAELIKEQNITFLADSNIPTFSRMSEYLVEPSPQAVLENLAKHLLFMQVYHLILEANAAEHSARRMAMKTASDNASDLGQALNLQYNKVRQASITNQIIEISAGAEALS